MKTMVFCHVTRACQGVLFETLDKVVNLMPKTATQTGLSTTVRVMRKAYETGRHATQEFRQNIKFKLSVPDGDYLRERP
jgi:hypothetical protein